jgi:hydroxylamine reductase (hybrid-cluster protein)
MYGTFRSRKYRSLRDSKAVTVPLTIEKGPFIVVTGHDLKDLHLLLEQTKDKGINIYTHGEMLPAHAYPKLKAYSHLKGNFGTAWQNQKKEFDNIPAPFYLLQTALCLLKKLIRTEFLQRKQFHIRIPYI